MSTHNSHSDKMTRNITLSVSDELSEKMKEHKDVKWSEVARQAIEKRITDLETLEKIAQKSHLTKRETEELSRKIDRKIAKKLGLR